MVLTDSNIRLLDGYLKSYKIELCEEQLRKLLRHIDLVIDKNQVMNLTRIVDPRDAIIRHVVDSLLLMPSVQRYVDASYGKFVDIGTGAGFPGIPLGVATAMTGTLIDSVGKKCNAVNEFIEELGLGERLKALPVRAEDLARDTKSSYYLVVARAVAELAVLVEYASPLLKRGGHLIVSKANVSDDEYQRGVETGEIVGLTYVSRETFELPEDAGHREILVFEHNKKSKVKLPRKNGDAKHKPLV